MRKESSCGVKKIRFETEMFRVNLASRFWSSLSDVPLASSSISLLRRGQLHFFSPLIAMMMVSITIDSHALLRLRFLLRWCLFGGDDR